MKPTCPATAVIRRRAVREGALVLLLAMATMMAGCGDDRSDAPTAERRAEPATATVPASPDWLAANNRTPPEQWLADHLNGGDTDGHRIDAAAIAKLLHAASLRFQENPRMIANRAHQLEGMLHDVGIHENAAQLIERLLTLPDQPHLKGFSANCQHYFNLREQGLDPDSALAALANG